MNIQDQYIEEKKTLEGIEKDNCDISIRGYNDMYMHTIRVPAYSESYKLIIKALYLHISGLKDQAIFNATQFINEEK